MRSFIRPTFRIETAAFLFCAQCLGDFRFCKSCSPMADIRDQIFCEARKKASPSLVTEIVKRSRHSERLRGLAKAVGRRTNFFLARSVSKIG